MTKVQLELNKDFKNSSLVAITGCGSTPGINNIMIKYPSQFFSEIDTIEAGFAWDSNIKKFVVPFSIESILKKRGLIVFKDGVALNGSPAKIQADNTLAS